MLQWDFGGQHASNQITHFAEQTKPCCLRDNKEEQTTPAGSAQRRGNSAVGQPPITEAQKPPPALRFCGVLKSRAWVTLVVEAHASSCALGLAACGETAVRIHNTLTNPTFGAWEGPSM